MKIYEEKGITLIALVITIIVLLLLAGISISMLTGENGIIMQVQEAQIKTNAGRIQEELNLWATAQVKNEYLQDAELQELLEARDYYEFNYVDTSTTPPTKNEEVGEMYTAAINEYMEEAYTESKSELIQRLVDEGVLAEEDREKLISNNSITLGDQTISFSNTLTIALQPGDYVTYEAPESVENLLKEYKTYDEMHTMINFSDSFNYDSLNNSDTWMVLHNNIKGHVEIAPVNSVDRMTFGSGFVYDSGGITSLPDDYLDGVKQINDATQKYINTEYAIAARGMGTDPYEPRKDEIIERKDLGYENFSSMNYQELRDSMAISYTRDPNTLLPRITLYDYIFAARDITHKYNNIGSDSTFFELMNNSVDMIRMSQEMIYKLDKYEGAYLDQSKASTPQTTASIIPVVKLRDDLVVVGGKGTIEEPWIIGVE